MFIVAGIELMADILINEISQNYSYVIGDNSYCCVALPITASWGPAYTGAELKLDTSTGKIVPSGDSNQTVDEVVEQAIEDTVWTRFRANSQGLESFVSTYRGAAANYRLANDYSYQMAVSLLTAGYDVLVCRVSPGAAATGKMDYTFTQTVKESDLSGTTTLTISLNRKPIDENGFVCTSTNPNFNKNYNKIILGKDGKQTADSKKWIEYDSANNAIKLYLPTDTDTEGKRLYPDWASVGIMAVDSISVAYTADICAVNSDGEAEDTGTLTLTAKYPGTFGNNIRCSLRKMNSAGIKYWNLITYIQDTSGVRLAVENMVFTFDIANSTDNIPYIEEVSSQFVNIVAEGLNEDTIFAAKNGQSDADNGSVWIEFDGGYDRSDETDIPKCLENTIAYVGSRYNENPKKKTSEEDVEIKISKDILEAHTKYILLTEAPTDWSTNYADYFMIDQEGKYVNVSGESAPTWEADKYYKGLTTLNIKYYATHNGTTIKSDAETPIVSVDGAPSLAITTDYTISSDKLIITFTPAGISKFADDTEYTYKVKCNVEDWFAQTDYLSAFCDLYNKTILDGTKVISSPIDVTTAQTLLYREWVFTNCLPVYDLLTDKLAYNPNRLISPGWDDQDFLFVTGEDKYSFNMQTVSPLQIKLMSVAYGSRCATAYLDIPRSLSKKYVTNSSQDSSQSGYAQKLSRYNPGTDGLCSTHSALFGPWGNYPYVGTNKQSIASPSFLALLIQRSMVLNQSLQYEWIQPTSRKNNVKIGKMDYTVSKKYLDLWQPDPDTEGGVGVNAIANIPDLGLSVWGDSTLYENPPATYQALRNLSTRLLVNAIKNVVYRVGISITFQYTNQTAFSSFYVGVTPILDSMKNAGAIGNYKVVIGNDFDALGMVKANSCVGKIFITPSGTIQRITIDLIALPPGTDLTNYS